MSILVSIVVTAVIGAAAGYGCGWIADSVIEEGTGKKPRPSGVYFAVAGGLLAAALSAAAGGELATLRLAVFMLMLAGIALADAKAMLIPDTLSIGGAALGVLLSGLPGAPGFVPALIGCGGALLFMVIIATLGSIVFRKEAMGGGDIKMLAMIGAFCGPSGAFVALFAGALAAVVVALPFGTRGRVIPFGVFLAAGGALAGFFGQEVMSGYGSLIMRIAG